MKDFPKLLVGSTTVLDQALLGEADAELIKKLAEKGFEVHAGLTAAYADDISQMCRQPSIREYCPNDVGRRFTDLAAAKAWLAKGRDVFLLLKKEADGMSLSGYGWAGPEDSTHVPGSKVTFAVRIGEGSQGQGLSTPFSRLIIAGTAKIYEAADFWLETWASDGAAVHIYHKLGFENVDSVADKRPSTEGTVDDTRLYMRLPNELL